jgi:hypothetical protein
VSAAERRASVPEAARPEQAGAPAAGIDQAPADVDKAFGVESAAGGGGQLRAEPGVRVLANKSGKPVDVTVGGGRQAKENPAFRRT